MPSDSSASPAYTKVPEVTLVFWIIKIAATTLAETGGDSVTMTLNWGYLATRASIPQSISMGDAATPHPRCACVTCPSGPQTSYGSVGCSECPKFQATKRCLSWVSWLSNLRFTQAQSSPISRAAFPFGANSVTPRPAATAFW